MKNIRFILTLLIALFSWIAVYPQDLKWVKFKWVGDSVGKRYLDKIAIDLPVQIENMPYGFSMQFDLGASSSILYGLAIAPYLQANKELNDKIDTLEKTWIDSKQFPTFKGISLKLDNVTFNNVHLGYYKGYGDSLTLDSVKTNTVKQIGTIGFDFFQNKVLIIDYPNSRICVTDAIPGDYLKKGSFINCKFEDGTIMVPVQIGDKTVYLMFDTGSSIFSLVTNETNAKEVAGQNTPVADSLGVSSWGKIVYMYKMNVNSEIKLGGSAIPISEIYYQKRPWDYFFVSHNIWGITGNVFFLNDIVVLDFKNHKFGVVKP